MCDLVRLQFSTTQQAIAQYVYPHLTARQIQDAILWAHSCGDIEQPVQLFRSRGQLVRRVLSCELHNMSADDASSEIQLRRHWQAMPLPPNIADRPHQDSVACVSFQKASLQFYTTDNAQTFEKQASAFFGQKVEAKHTDLA